MSEPEERPATPLGSPGQRPVLAERLTRPFQRFLELEVSSALLLVAMTVVALVWANSPWADSYVQLWHHTHAGIQIGNFELSLSLGEWVNDALMAIFFFVVGMEIKRELVQGELSTRAKAMFPVMGAVGGMVVPAGVYAAFHWGEPTIRGWGIPMATDIAFAVAALSLLGKRVPPGLRIFLLALAIADDIGAVTVIAIFYTAEIHLSALGLAAAGLVSCLLLNRAGVRSFLVYLVVGTFVWHEMHHSGVHATIAGVLLGFVTPTALPDRDTDTLVERARGALDRLREVVTGHKAPDGPDDLGGHQRMALARQLQEVGREVMSPVDFLTNLLERWVAFVIMPIFALANAGVRLDAATLEDPVAQQVALAVGLGLVVGKPVGVALLAWIAVRTRLAVLPRGVRWPDVFATGVLAGIGFTVALFVTALAFGEGVPGSGAKLGILVGSLGATLLGLGILVRTLPPADGSSNVR